MRAPKEWKAYNILQEKTSYPKLIDTTVDIPLSTYLGIAGMPGQTAFYGLRQFGKMKKGETIFVSSASGGVGA